jgi:hypothetical protein
VTYLTIRSPFVTLLKGISGIGEVHEVWKHTVDWEKFKQRYVKDGRVNDWEVTQTELANEIENVQNADGNLPIYRRTHLFTVRGMLGLKESDLASGHTETKFMEIIDAITGGFEADPLLGGSILLPALPQFTEINHSSFGGVLCHFTQFTYNAAERTGG